MSIPALKVNGHVCKSQPELVKPHEDNINKWDYSFVIIIRNEEQLVADKYFYSFTLNTNTIIVEVSHINMYHVWNIYKSLLFFFLIADKAKEWWDTLKAWCGAYIFSGWSVLCWYATGSHMNLSVKRRRKRKKKKGEKKEHMKPFDGIKLERNIYVKP